MALDGPPIVATIGENERPVVVTNGGMQNAVMAKDQMFKLRLDGNDRERLDAIAAHYSAPAATVLRILIKKEFDLLGGAVVDADAAFVSRTSNARPTRASRARESFAVSERTTPARTPKQSVGERSEEASVEGAVRPAKRATKKRTEAAEPRKRG